MSGEYKDYELVARINEAYVNQRNKEAIKAKLLDSENIPSIVKEIVEERKILLEWIDAILIKNGRNDSTLLSKKGYDIWNAWKGHKRYLNRPKS